MSTSTPAIRTSDAPKFDHHECIEVACTDCGESLGEDWTLHFESITQALASIADAEWTITDDHVRCLACTDRHGDDSADTGTSTVIVTKCEYCWPPLFSDSPPPLSCQCDQQRTTTEHHVHVPFISRAHCAFTTRSCVTLTCGECGNPVNDDESEPHYSSAEKALEIAARDYDWLVTDVLVCCARCAKGRACTLTGHQFPEHPNHVTAGGIEIRFCANCDETVSNPIGDRDQPWL